MSATLHAFIGATVLWAMDVSNQPVVVMPFIPMAVEVSLADAPQQVSSVLAPSAAHAQQHLKQQPPTQHSQQHQQPQQIRAQTQVQKTQPSPLAALSDQSTPAAPAPAPAAVGPLALVPIGSDRSDAESPVEPSRAMQVLTPASFDADYLSNPAPPYPPMSRRLGEQGTVLLSVWVDANGSARLVDLKRSSGHARLDAAARDAVAHWRFVPARRGADPVDAQVLVPVVFRLTT
jgi:protein TonB